MYRTVAVAGVLLACGGAVSPETGNSNLDNLTGAGRAGSSASNGGGGSGASGGAASGGATSAGSSPSSNPSGSGPCWQGSLPLEPQPIPLVEADFDVACQTALAATAELPPPDFNRSVDSEGLLVGRFRACGAPLLASVPHEVVEFGGNRRFRFLAADPAGELQVTDSGYFYFLDTGQLNLQRGNFTTFTRLAVPPGAQAFRVDGAVYARIAPAADNGRSNAPSLSDGACTLEGDWDATSSGPAERQGTFSFDSSGNFVVHDPGANVCSSTAMYGTYQLTPGTFEITSNVGLGACSWSFAASYQATFEGCGRLRLQVVTDNCTGGRGYLNGSSLLVKR